MKNNKIFNANNLLLFLFVLIFSLPRTLQEVKIILIICILLQQDLKLKKSFLKQTIIYSSLFLIPLIVGFFYSNNFTLIFSALKINVFWVIFLFYILMYFENEQLIDILKKSTFISFIIILLLTINTFLFAIGLLSFNINSYFYPTENIFGLHEGYVHLINSSLSYTIFIVPILFYNQKMKNLDLKYLLFFIFGLIIIFISGRRILLLPYILLFITQIRKLWPFILLLSFIIINPFNNIEIPYFDFDIITERFLSAINSNGDSEVRKEQEIEFISEIIKRPFFGKGFGAFMENYKRNDDFSMAYERTFHYMAFSFGLLSMFFIFVYYLFLFIKFYLINKYKYKNFHIGFLIALISILISSHTNPYWLSGFDYCLPLALLIRLTLKANNITDDKYRSI